MDQIGEGQVREAVLEGVCREQLDEISKKQPTDDGAALPRLGEWIRQVESQELRDTLTAEYVRNLEKGGSAKADPWANATSNPALKEATQKWLLQNREMNRLLGGQ